MPEHLEQQNAESLDLQRIMGIVRRRHLHFLIPLFLGWVATWTLSWVLPVRYKSGTLILVEQPTMPKNYVVPNINDDLQERLQSISQQILSRTRLEHIIQHLNLYPKDRSRLSPDEVVEHMRKDIQIELVHNSDNQISAFNIYYSAGSAKMAQQVTSELSNLFINENLEVRQEQSEGTTKFLENQLESARQSLAEQESKVREFKGQHVGELPTQVASNMQILGGLQSQLQSEEDALNAAKQQHVYLETLVGPYRSLRTSAKGAEGSPLGLSAIDVELDKLKGELADLSSHYTDRHPDIRKLKDQIAKNERMREQLLADIKMKTDKSQPDDSAGVGNAGELTQTSPLAQLESQLHANDVEIKNREQAVTALKSRINDYQARLNQEPVREQQLAELTRGYDQSKENYDELLKKKNDSAMATRMELLQQGERFHVLDPPSLPFKPAFPNRLKFCGMGLGIGIALGTVVAGAFELMDDRLYSEKDLKELLPVAVITEIPPIVNVGDEQKKRRRIWLGWATAALVMASILAGSAVSFLRG
jgi:polysaccharide biosynthesis transport protein